MNHSDRNPPPRRLLYLGAELPALSETFVYREVFALRRSGVPVEVASVHAPQTTWSDPELARLAQHAIPIYGAGGLRLLVDALRSFARQPLRSLRVICLAIFDLLFGRDVSWRGRPKIFVQALAALALGARLRERRIVIDHIHAHMAHVPTTIAMYLAMWLGVPFSFTGHAADLFRDHSLLPAKLRRARFVACISHWHREFYREIVPELSTARLPLVRCGVEEAWFADPASIAAASRTSDRPLQLLAVGRLVEKKGFDRLLEALALVIPDLPPLQLTLIGDGPERAALAEQTRRLQLEPFVTFCGSRSNDEVRAALATTDLLVLPCRPTASGDRDGIPVVLMEGMAAGLPVISGDLVTIRELITSQETGWLVPPGDVKTLAATLRHVLLDDEARRRCGAAARAFVHQEFSVSGNVARLWSALTDGQSLPSLSSNEATHDRPLSAVDLQGDVMIKSSRRYCLISPCRNEATFVRRTLDSVLAQSERPALWVIIDDGSTDETPEILASYAALHPWIQVVSRPDRGRRAVGGGVIEAFQAGLASIDLDSFDYLCKLDVDLDLPTTYFARLMDRMEADRSLGTCSGKPYYPAPENIAKTFAGPLISEGIGDDMSVGAAKFYRVACFRQIGGFVQQVMWDGIDCHRCRMLGWRAVSWDEPALRFLHLRPMGSSQQGIITGRLRHGFGQHFMGTSLLYMTASSVFRLAHRPRIVGSLAMWWGFVRSVLRGLPRYHDHEFRKFLRQYQWRCLTQGKVAAMEWAERTRGDYGRSR